MQRRKGTCERPGPWPPLSLRGVLARRYISAERTRPPRTAAGSGPCSGRPGPAGSRRGRQVRSGSTTASEFGLGRWDRQPYCLSTPFTDTRFIHGSNSCGVPRGGRRTNPGPQMSALTVRGVRRHDAQRSVERPTAAWGPAVHRARRQPSPAPLAPAPLAPLPGSGAGLPAAWAGLPAVGAGLPTAGGGAGPEAAAAARARRSGPWL